MSKFIKIRLGKAELLDADGQIDRHKGRQIDRQTDRQTDGQAGRQEVN